MVICANKILKAVITLLIIWVWGASIIKVQSLYNCGECEETSQHVVRADNLVDHMGQKLQDGKKVICVSLNSPHSERPPGQTAGPSNLPFWILGIHYRANSHKKFHLPGTIFKGLKFKGKNCQNGPFLIILSLNFRPLKIVPGR